VPGVRLHADVADVRPYLGESGVMAVPLRIGGGSRLTILEALACGLPGCREWSAPRGCAWSGADLVLVPRAEDMAAALVESVRSPAPGLAMAERGRRVVLERYDWDALALKLERVVEECARGSLVVGAGAGGQRET